MNFVKDQRLYFKEKDEKIKRLLFGGDTSPDKKSKKYERNLEQIEQRAKMSTSRFDITDYLDSKEMIAEYLNTVLAEGDNPDLIIAIGHSAKAIGMTKKSEETGLSRRSLNKALSDGAKLQFATIMKVLKAMGLQIQVNPISALKITTPKEGCK